MKKITVVLATLVLFSVLPAAAQKVFIDYDRARPFSEYRTYQVYESKQDLRFRNPAVHREVMDALEKYLAQGALEKVDADPDAYITYYVARDRSLTLALSDLRYGYGPNFTWGRHWEGGVGERTPEDFTVKTGALIVDVWDADEQLLIWRGIATAKLTNDPEKNARKAVKAVDKLVKQWDGMYGASARNARGQKIEDGG